MNSHINHNATILMVVGLVGIAIGLVYNMNQSVKPNFNFVELNGYVNSLREENGLKIIKLNSELQKAAEYKCGDMVAKHYYDHISPDGTTPLQMIVRFAPSAKSVGENLTVNAHTSRQAFDDWVNSPEHKQNMLDPKYTDEGFAFCQDGQRTYVVQDFAQY